MVQVLGLLYSGSKEFFKDFFVHKLSDGRSFKSVRKYYMGVIVSGYERVGDYGWGSYRRRLSLVESKLNLA